MINSALIVEEAVVEFVKADGSIRTMRCTLKDVPEYVRKTDRVKVKKEDLMSVWDVENNGWRSFNLSKVNSMVRVYFNASAGAMVTETVLFVKELGEEVTKDPS